MINGLRRIPVCVWLAVFAILSPAISWAETSQQTIELGREAELIAIRTLAFAGPDGPHHQVNRGPGRPSVPKKGFSLEHGTWE